MEGGFVQSRAASKSGTLKLSRRLCTCSRETTQGLTIIWDTFILKPQLYFEKDKWPAGRGYQKNLDSNPFFLWSNTLQGTNPHPTFGKGKSSTQNCRLRGLCWFPRREVLEDQPATSHQRHLVTKETCSCTGAARLVCLGLSENPTVWVGDRLLMVQKSGKKKTSWGW